jgi:Zn-dependent protease with chaperone function
MSFLFEGERYLGFKEYINQSSPRLRLDPSAAPAYVHPVDGWILKTLNAAPVKAAFNKAVDTLVSYQFGLNVAEAVAITPKSFPEIHSILCHCAQTLNIPVPHAVARHDPALFNASTAGTDEYAFINVSTALLTFFSTEEAHFVIGHECGHIAAGHMLFHTVVASLYGAVVGESPLGRAGAVISTFVGLPILGIPLLAWSRRSEVTADRAGLLCCGDLVTAERALLKLVTGFAGLQNVNIEDYLQQARRAGDFHRVGMFHALFKSHPLIPQRIKALRLFARSQTYFELTGKLVPAGMTPLSQKELDRRVNQIVRP